jgi:hypothetical protein
MNFNAISFVLGTALLMACPLSATAASAVKICENEVPVANIKVIESSAANISREQVEFERQGYIVQRCRVDLPAYHIRGEALILHDAENNVLGFIYRD